jgi:hypothetical protein
MLQTLTKYCITAFALGFAVAACTQDGGRPAPTAQIPPGFGLFFQDEGGSAKLAYGEANSDNVGLMMECAKGSQLVQVSDLVRSSPAPLLTLVSGGRATQLKTEVEAGMGAPIYTASAPAAAPALAAFRRSGRMEVSYAGLRYGVAAKPNERMGVEKFFSACEGRPA